MSVFTGCGKMHHISLALKVFLILLNFQLVRGIWRYSTVMKNDKLFTIRNPILLEFIDPKSIFMKWGHSPGCTVSNSTALVTYLRCHSEGFHWVQPYYFPDVKLVAPLRNIYVSQSFFTFAWYAAINSSSDGITKTMRIWIIDPEEASDDEIGQIANVPSRHSYYLTKNFFNLGQFPKVTLPSSTKTFTGKFTPDRFWEMVLEWKQSYLTVGIGGQSVSFQHRFVYEASHTFNWEPKEGPYDGTEIPLLGPNVTILIKDPCAPHRALFMTRNSIRITSDAFRSTSVVKMYSLYTRPPSGFYMIDNAALLDDGIILHMADGLYWRSHQTRFFEFREELPTIGVRGILQRTTCLDNHPLQEVVDFGTVLFWTDNELFIGGGRITSRRAVGTYKELLFQVDREKRILTAAFGSDPNTVGILFTQTSIYKPVLMIFNHQTSVKHPSSFLESGVSPENMPRGLLHMRFYESTKETLLLWNQTALWYSFRDNNQWGTLKVPGFHSLGSAVPGKNIHEVMLDQKWNLLVKMTNNQMFFCKFGVTELVWLEYWVRGGIPASLHTDQKNQVILVTEQELEDDVQFELNPFPLKLEAMSSMLGITHHDCPYVTFKHSMNNYGYYLDKGQELLFWAEVVYHEGKGVHIQVLRSRAKLLEFDLSNDFECIHGVFMVTMTIKTKQKMDYTLSENYTFDMDKSQGVMRVEIVPNLIANRCDLPKNRVSYFSVGCPPNRHIRIARPWGMDCDMHTFHNYTIPGFANDDDMVIYDWNNWGCVLKIHFQSAFKPALDLYDGDKFVKTVDANFVVSEMFGRTDYSYNTTMRQVGCLREAQTRDKMLNLSLQQTWGPGTYKTCFKLESGVARNLHKPYEIMNRSSSNHMTFSQEDSAVYVFTVRILDPNYSFCDLTTIFAVQTYGMSKPMYEHLIPYVTLSVTFISLCILGYSYYKYVYIFREIQERAKAKKS